MEKKRKLLTIGQFAALHGINKKTLMWYDEIGLFRPAFIQPENGYRYYSYYQSAILETILLLRELDVPIGEIQAFMKNRSAASMEQLLREKLEDLDRRIAHLKAVRQTLSGHHRNMLTLLNMELSEISIVEKEERSLVTVDVSQDTSFDKLVDTGPDSPLCFRPLTPPLRSRLFLVWKSTRCSPRRRRCCWMR